MNEQERKMLEEALELSRENNAMVRKLVRAQQRATLLRIFYWAIIIGSTIIAYYSIQPYISMMSKLFTGQDISVILDSFSALPR